MELKGRFQYIYDAATEVWIPWEGTAAGFGGVTLYTVAGSPLGTDDLGASLEPESSAVLITNSLTYGFDDDSNTYRVVHNLADNTDANSPVADFVLTGAVTRLQGFNGTTYDRLRSFAGNVDNVAVPTLGLLGSAAFNYAYDGTNWDRIRSVTDNVDAVATIGLGNVSTLSHVSAFNGTSYDRLRTNSAAVLSGTTQPFGTLSAQPGEWSINHTPAANTQATITRAAGAAGVRHVCRSINASLIGLAASAEATVLVNLRDGATGAGTILWSDRLLVQGTVGNRFDFSLSGLNIFGSAATAMTLEFAAAGGANTFESVAITGYDTI